MKRDMDLVRDILLLVEEKGESVFEDVNIAIDDRSRGEAHSPFEYDQLHQPGTVGSGHHGRLASAMVCPARCPCDCAVALTPAAPM